MCVGQDNSPQTVRAPALLTPLCLVSSVNYGSYCVRPNSGRIDAGKHVEVQGRSLPQNRIRIVITFLI